MKTLKKTFWPAVLFGMAAGLLWFTACNDDNDEPKPGEDLSWAQPGAEEVITATNFDGTTASLSIEIIENVGGISEAIIIDEEGDTAVFEFKATTEGIYDYVLSNGDRTKPSTLVEYNADVGMTWTYTVPSGTVVRRELISKGNIYVVSQTYPTTAFEWNLDRIEWRISPSRGVRGCTLYYNDQGPVTFEIN